MELPTLYKLKKILNRYTLDLRTLNDDGIEIGRGNNIKLLRFYYLYFPLIIGSIIITVGFISEFALLTFCGVPFLLYAIYGVTQVYQAIRANLNTMTIRKGEIKLSLNQVITTLNSTHIKDYEIKLEYIDEDLYEGKLRIKDIEGKEYVLFTFIDHDQSKLNDNLDFLSQFIQTKTNI